jgi:hypothetical protein
MMVQRWARVVLWVEHDVRCCTSVDASHHGTLPVHNCRPRVSLGGNKVNPNITGTEHGYMRCQ